MAIKRHTRGFVFLWGDAHSYIWIVIPSKELNTQPVNSQYSFLQAVGYRVLLTGAFSSRQESRL